MKIAPELAKLFKNTFGTDISTITINGQSLSEIDQDITLDKPWKILELSEKLIADLSEDKIAGEVHPNANIEGKVHIGKGSRILPGVYIEGNVSIGENCKVGPNCYIRGNTSIGDNCHIGQSVEIKNSLILSNSNVGHLSYVGDSILCEEVNFGAGTITSNYRHDKGNHTFIINGEVEDTGRRKFGAIIGKAVHTGINTSIYPGRYISTKNHSLPGEIVRKNK